MDNYRKIIGIGELYDIPRDVARDIGSIKIRENQDRLFSKSARNERRNLRNQSFKLKLSENREKAVFK